MKNLIIDVVAGMLLLCGCQAPVKDHTPINYPGDKTTMEKQTTESGLAYIEISLGTGTSPKSGDKVTVHYTGYLTDGIHGGWG